MTGLYIHIPFCKSKCAYCDFLSYVGKEKYIESYIDSVISEAAEYGGQIADTVFIGGGTPSVLPKGEIKRLLDGVKKHIEFTDAAEITAEANPNSLTEEKAEEYKSAGINRVSLGLQTANARLLKRIGRTHTFEDFFNAVSFLRAAGIENINADIIYSLPSQTIDDIEDTVGKLILLDIPHVSAYALKLEPGTPLFKENPELPDEDTDRRMFYLIRDMLKEEGIFRYEISNFAKSGYECAHNLKYWRVEDYIGLGAAAHSCFSGRRFYNPHSLTGYISGEKRGEEPVDFEYEKIMLGLRLTEGIDKELLKPAKSAVKRLKEWGLLTVEGKRAFLTDRGMDVENAVLAEIFEEMEKNA